MSWTADSVVWIGLVSIGVDSMKLPEELSWPVLVILALCSLWLAINLLLQ